MKTDQLIDSIGQLEDSVFEGIILQESDYKDEGRAEQKRLKQQINLWVKWGTIAACLCFVAIGAAIIMPKLLRDKGDGMDGGKQPIAGGIGINEGSTYSVAVLPADKNLNDVQDAYCNEISIADIQKEEGLRDYVPSKLPDGFHFDQASLYITIVNDGTIYKRLLITYRTGKGAKKLLDEEGAELIPDTNDLGDEFRINIFSFMPDTSVETYSADEIRNELQKGNLGKGYFYVKYGDYYVGIEPLSLNADEILALIDGIG
ncbi:MAG: hypothetical protein IK007_03315 [Lachnospiraceae bacterium]|nr:hypothetical protein [Lachnospiraceae bacterium]